MAIRPEALLQCLKTDLASYGFDPECVEISEGSSILQAAAASIRSSLLKKLSVGMTDATQAVALDKFLTVNAKCEGWALPSDLSDETKVLLGTLRRLLDDFWHEGGFALADHPFQMLAEASVGPGANRLARAGSFYSKLFASPLSCSHIGLYNWYSRYVRSFPCWSEAEIFRSEQYGPARLVTNSRLSFVPKNDKESRTICTEPTLNTFFQLGFGRIIERRLLRFFGVNLQDQQFKNRALARLGSLTDGLSTIDLSSASDSISLGMLRWALPASFLRMLEFSRCTHSEVPGAGTVGLNMVSTMGNGFTFPLQTVLFSAVVASCMIVRGIPWRDTAALVQKQFWREGNRVGASSEELWGVFGDDIVCPRSVTGDVVSLLALLGFSVNRDKTFLKGPFRESCGHDFFRGVMIRGVYVKTVDNQQDCAAVLNQLTRFSARTGLLLHQTMRCIRDWYPDMPMVPCYEDMSAGFHTDLETARESKHALWDRNRYWYRYQYWSPRPRYYRIAEGRVSNPAGCKSLIYNPHGLWVSQLQGSVNSFKIGIRDNRLKWKKKRRVTSSWDDTTYCRDSWSNDHDLDWGRWKTVISSLK